MLEGAPEHGVERRVHHLLQVFEHALGAPVVAHAVLDPLEVRHADAAGIAQDVRDDEDLLLLQDVVGLGRARPVGALRDELGLDPRPRSCR